MNKTALKRLEEVTTIGLGESITTDQHPWTMIFLLKAIVMEQDKRLTELEFQIAELKGQVEPA